VISRLGKYYSRLGYLLVDYTWRSSRLSLMPENKQKLGSFVLEAFSRLGVFASRL